ncbi:integumentary mucin B.1-like [Polypterus senegalus]|uniref:integumentary mucin B.1-like n=1 Tax=Polypterus senegalus TaxID=55291 RepID=UPI00196503B1|nr:integumentary mucin B.1-like [Polypterus senegalus]
MFISCSLGSKCKCSSVPTCSSTQELVTVNVSGQCCPNLKCVKKKNDCNVVYSTVTVQKGQCSAQVQIPSCSGFCSSSQIFTPEGKWESQCSCCKKGKVTPMSFTLNCKNGKTKSYSINVPQTCNCQSCN